MVLLAPAHQPAEVPENHRAADPQGAFRPRLQRDCAEPCGEPEAEGTLPLHIDRAGGAADRGGERHDRPHGQ